MRGKGVGAAHLAGDHGITPAYAGKRQKPATLGHFEGDHPRVCGEKSLTLLMAGLSTGSPPRMRGKVVTVDRNQIALGITPAYAGKRFGQS